ncbi:hypothetical protein DFH07DRAFT_726241 [Mycena maculata]|uniref:Uncharacterized protein n=1 Tax=Mycena maculata TaxID=230809 RepID=A0AAD7KGF2_9AGAR|nr:hypothetical protein DFH07DRAFT_726241 [Mycena maculata]
MRPVAPFRLSLLRRSLEKPPRHIVPFHARPALFSPFSTHPSHAQHQLPTKSQQSYFRRVDKRIAETFGIGKSMRITLYVILGVASAIETWFYCFWMWQWWKRRVGQESDGEVEA